MSRRRASNSDSLASSTMNEAIAYPHGMQQNMLPQRRGPIEGPGGRRLTRRVTWRSSTYKLMATLWVLGVLYIVYLIRDIFYLPFTYSSKHPVNLNADLLAQYAGRRECGISSQSLYLPPQSNDDSVLSNSYCQTRDSLLNSMSYGGRHGFDAVYTSQSCFYRWYSDAEICDILQRFDAILFIGDDTLADAYAGLNILLRKNLKLGSLKEWDLDKELRSNCQCDSQFTGAQCIPQRITSSDEVYSQEKTKSPYTCSTRTPHIFLPTNSSPASESAHEKFRRLVTSSFGQNKPVPVILSLSLSTSYSLLTAKGSMDEWLALAKTSARHTPFLWIGPTAPGHQNPPEDNVHAISWKYTEQSANEAHSRGIDVLGMYNATLQAESWDGMHYGEKVALMEAMMIINWLSTL